MSRVTHGVTRPFLRTTPRLRPVIIARSNRCMLKSKTIIKIPNGCAMRECNHKLPVNQRSGEHEHWRKLIRDASLTSAKFLQTAECRVRPINHMPPHSCTNFFDAESRLRRPWHQINGQEISQHRNCEPFMQRNAQVSLQIHSYQASSQFQPCNAFVMK